MGSDDDNNKKLQQQIQNLNNQLEETKQKIKDYNDQLEKTKQDNELLQEGLKKHIVCLKNERDKIVIEKDKLIQKLVTKQKIIIVSNIGLLLCCFIAYIIYKIIK